MSSIFHLTDLHYGNGGKQDDYVQNPQLHDKSCGRLIEIADAQREDPDTIVVVTGDMVNGEYGTLERITSKPFGEFMDFLRPLKPIICVGNHDSEIWKYRDHPVFNGCIMREEFIVNGMLFMHGHQVDLACGKRGWIGKAVSGLAFLIGKVNPKWEDALRGGNGGRDANARKFAKKCIEYARKKGCHTACVGHSHESQIVEDHYCNAGLWARDGYLKIEG